MYSMKDEHLDIETNLEYLIKPDVCADWATHLTFLSEGSDEDFILTFTHLEIFEGGETGDTLFLEIRDNGAFPEDMLKVFRNPERYPTLQLAYGVADTEDAYRRAKALRSIHFKGCLKMTFHCSVKKVGRYTSTLYLAFRNVELATDNVEETL